MRLIGREEVQRRPNITNRYSLLCSLSLKLQSLAWVNISISDGHCLGFFGLTYPQKVVQMGMIVRYLQLNESKNLRNVLGELQFWKFDTVVNFLQLINYAGPLTFRIQKKVEILRVRVLHCQGTGEAGLKEVIMSYKGCALTTVPEGIETIRFLYKNTIQKLLLKGIKKLLVEA